jgi:HEAT repeat protein
VAALVSDASIGEVPEHPEPDFSQLDRTFTVGPVKGIPVVDRDDPRIEQLLADEREAAAVVDAAAPTQPGLLAALEDPRWLVRHTAIPRLSARYPDSVSRDVILNRLKSDPDHRVRRVASSALKRFPGDERVLKALRNSARSDPSEEVRDDAMFALDYLEDPPGE